MIRIEIDPVLSAAELAAVWPAEWGAPPHNYAERVLSRSLAHLGAYDGAQLAGFVNVAWDGGVHAFLLDVAVAAEFRRQGIASALVRRAAEVARERGALWLHVDFEPHLEPFYRSCGFAPTLAGLIRL